MSTHTTYFCDHCNDDRDIQRGDDDGHAINYGEYPVGDGWAEFNYDYTNSSGGRSTAEVNICAHCLADPDFEPKSNWEIPEWDRASRENFEKARKHAGAFGWAEEHLGTPDRWGTRRGVRQVFGDGRLIGPKLDDGSWTTQFADWEYERAARDQVRVDALFAAAAA